MCRKTLRMGKKFDETVFDKLVTDIQNNVYKDTILSLRHDHYYGKGMGDKQVKKLVIAVKNNKFITAIDLYAHDIGDLGAGYLSELSLDHLSLCCNNIWPPGAKSLSKSNIRRLDLSGNYNVGPVGAAYFCNSTKIEELLLSESNIGNAGATAVFQNKHIKLLDISANDITNVSGICNATSLVEINLEQNKIGYENKDSIQHIANHKTLKIVNIGSNWLEDSGVGILANSTSIECLNLWQNFITEVGFFHLLANTNIKELFLFNNDIKFSGTEKQQQQLPFNNTLVKLRMGNNRIGDYDTCKKDIHQHMLKQLVSIPSLTELDLSHNGLTDDDALLIDQYHDPSIVEIDLISNYIDDTQLVKRLLNRQ